jgi:hypothetical protein
MRKFVWMPVVSLGRKSQGQFLEIMSEPACFGGINMDALKNCGLAQNVAETERVLRQLSAQPSCAHLYLTCFLANLSNTQGINFGLLAASFIQKIIVTGHLDITKAYLPVSESSHFVDKVNAILNLGKQPEPLPFFFPRVLAEGNTLLLSKLAAMNIVLKPIGSLRDVLMDFGMASQLKEM